VNKHASIFRFCSTKIEQAAGTFYGLQIHQKYVFGLWGSLQHSPDLLAEFEGQKGGKGRKDGREWVNTPK